MELTNAQSRVSVEAGEGLSTLTIVLAQAGATTGNNNRILSQNNNRIEAVILCTNGVAAIAGSNGEDGFTIPVNVPITVRSKAPIYAWGVGGAATVSVMEVTRRPLPETVHIDESFLVDMIHRIFHHHDEMHPPAEPVPEAGLPFIVEPSAVDGEIEHAAYVAPNPHPLDRGPVANLGSERVLSAPPRRAMPWDRKGRG